MITDLKILASGGPGTGKTTFGLSFPKVAWFNLEPGNRVLLETSANKQNLSFQGEYIPSITEDIRETFTRLLADIKTTHLAFKEGKVQTLFLDNLTYLFENRWMFINKYEKATTSKGALDVRSMYGTLGRWGYDFMLLYFLSFPGNVVVSCHEMREGEEALASKVDMATSIVPNILGGFREKAAGLFSAALFLGKIRLGENKYKYIARCQKGEQRDAKNRFGLPEIVENISYETLVNAIPKGEEKCQ